MNHYKTPLAFALVAALALAGCARGTDAPAGEDTPESAASAEAEYSTDGEADWAEAPEEAPTPPLSAGVIAGLERGLAKENEGLEAAVATLSRAETDGARLQALASIDMDGIEADAAAAAGLSPSDYVFYRDELFERLAQVEMHDMMRAQFEAIDTASLDEATRAEVEKSREETMAGLGEAFEGMDEAAVAAFRERQPRLAELQARHTTLVFSFLGE